MGFEPMIKRDLRNFIAKFLAHMAALQPLPLGRLGTLAPDKNNEKYLATTVVHVNYFIHHERNEFEAYI